MSATTFVTVAGQTREVRGSYAEVSAALRARRLTKDDGEREVTYADGGKATLNIGAVSLIESGVTRATRTIGFAAALEGASA